MANDEYKFCPKCGSALKKVVLEKDHPPKPVCTGDNCRYVVYKSSSPAVIALISDGEKIFLGKRGIAPKKDEWALPGGFLEDGEDPVEGLRREIREELGVEIGDPEILGIFIDTYSKDNNFVICVCYKATIKSGEPKTSPEIAELGWFLPGEIPPIGFDSHRKVINKWLSADERQSLN